MRDRVRFLSNGRLVQLPPGRERATLLDWLRLDQRATGTKEGCAEGDCGACTVVLKRLRGDTIVHEPVNACILLAAQADGAEVVTVEDLAGPGGRLHPVQAAMLEQHGSQCGFCTPGIVMSLYALHENSRRGMGEGEVTRPAVCDQLAGNLCRCTGYRPIIEAAIAAWRVDGSPAAGGEAEDASALGALRSLRDRDDVLIGDDTRFFAAPHSEQALAGLYLSHPDARLIAGATDAGLALTKGLEQWPKVIWLGRVDGLDVVEDTPEALILGATTSLAAAVPHLAAIDADLGEVMRRFGSMQVRTSGTVGGNLANGSPIGDLAPCLIALGAALELRRGDDCRTLALESFFLAYKTQDRRPGEYVRRVIIPKLLPGQQFRAYKISKRTDEDISAVLAAFSFRLDGRRIASARFGFGGMAGTPARARLAEQALAGVSLDDERQWRDAIAALDRDFTPLDDHRASAAYRRLVARNLLVKALAELAGAAPPETRVRPRQEMSHAAG